ncbi:hypothetical protein SLA2020_302800 [Shorea laevis]
MRIAKHYQTRESLPEDVYLKLLSARTFRAGSLSLHQIRFASVDFELHTKYIPLVVFMILIREFQGGHDAFLAFEAAGLDYSKAVTETGWEFQETILARGGGKAPLEVFIEFRGHEPSPEALLRHNGLLPVTASA